MMNINNWKRINQKSLVYDSIFGYMPPFPKEKDIYDYPDNHKTAYEIMLDKSIFDKYDFFQEEYGYDGNEIREKIKREEHTTYE